MNAQEFTQICFLVLVLLSCIAWLAYSTDQYDKKIQALEKRLSDKAQLLAESNERNTQFRQAHWDRLRLAVNNRIGSEEGLFSATQEEVAAETREWREHDAARPRFDLDEKSRRIRAMMENISSMPTIKSLDISDVVRNYSDRNWFEHDAAKIADGLIIASMEREHVRRAGDTCTRCGGMHSLSGCRWPA